LENTTLGTAHRKKNKGCVFGASLLFCSRSWFETIMTTTTAATATKTTAKKKRRRSPAAAKRPVNLKPARQEILRLALANSVAITQAVIGEALEGKYLCAKFLLEAAGLCALEGEEAEEEAERESLTGLLLKQWRRPSEGGQVTEVPRDAAKLALAEQAPVKS
jgi:hypothetical protein